MLSVLRSKSVSWRGIVSIALSLYVGIWISTFLMTVLRLPRLELTILTSAVLIGPLALRQWLLLRQSGKQVSPIWIAVSLLAVIVHAVFFMQLSTLRISRTMPTFASYELGILGATGFPWLSGVIFGLFLSACQWFVARATLTARNWIPINMLAWGVGMATQHEISFALSYLFSGIDNNAAISWFRFGVSTLGGVLIVSILTTPYLTGRFKRVQAEESMIET